MIALVAALMFAQALPSGVRPASPNGPGAAGVPGVGDPQAETEPTHQEPTVAVRPSNAHGPSIWSRAGHAIENGVRRLWEKDEAHATEGNLASLNGDVDKALQEYDASEKQLPPNSDAAAALAFDRSSALLKGTPEQAKTALEQAQAARESSDPELRAKAAYNAGVALEAQGKPDEAIKAYANALSLDPNDVDSKVNLELLLQDHQKNKPQAGQQDKDKKQQPQQDKDKQQQQAKGKEDQKKDDQQKQDDKQGDQKKDQQAQEKPDDKDKKEAKADQKKDENGQRGQQQDDKQDSQGEKKKDEAKQEQASIGRTEAQRLLDAARAGEKNLQMWRFGKKSDPHKQRSSAEKDW